MARSGLARAGAISSAALVLTLALAAGAPMLMVALAGTGLPWPRLAEVGEAFGGISALLSAMALSGVVASLLFQQRQIRQQIADIDGQHHMELLTLAINNPELIEVLDREAARGPHSRQEIYANLTMMYWLRLWELGEIEDDELRNMTFRMFQSDVTRRWWGRVADAWIGTRARPRRRRFIATVSDEMRKAEREARRRPDAGGGDPVPRPRRHSARPAVLATAGIAAMAAGYVYGRRTRPSRRS
ncbi:DUF6082 family protein [Actinoplanes sp. NPDC023714]|uniref:DUF6082 family protein n=1 Tax=Actinoplanes sp. NPDC023714 TaxID=3154322 RepID=UPI0033C73C1C